MALLTSGGISSTTTRAEAVPTLSRMVAAILGLSAAVTASVSNPVKLYVREASNILEMDTGADPSRVVSILPVYIYKEQ
jgi:hypothetical protein